MRPPELPELLQILLKLPQGLPELRHTLPELTQASTGLPVSPELSHDVFSTFLGTSHAVSYFLRRLLEGDLSEMVSKVYLLDGAVMKKSKNIAPERHTADFVKTASNGIIGLELIRGIRGIPLSSGSGGRSCGSGPPFHTRRGSG